MPKVALADSVDDWKGLIRQALPLAKDHPNLKRLLTLLQADLERAQELDNLCRSLKAARLQATKDLRQMKERGKLHAREARLEIKANYGDTNRELVRFGIKPRRPAKNARPPRPIPPPPPED